MINYYKSGLVVLLTGLLIFIYGCSEDGKVEEEYVPEFTEEETGPVNEVDKEDEPARQISTLEDVKSLIQIDMTEEEVMASLGDDFTSVTSSLDGLPVWRYDINTIEGYQFDGVDDEVDVEGIADEKLEYQVFVTWRDGKIEYFTIYYKVNDQLVEGYYEFNDGYTKVDQLPID